MTKHKQTLPGAWHVAALCNWQLLSSLLCTCPSLRRWELMGRTEQRPGRQGCPQLPQESVEGHQGSFLFTSHTQLHMPPSISCPLWRITSHDRHLLNGISCQRSIIYSLTVPSLQAAYLPATHSPGAYPTPKQVRRPLSFGGLENLSGS